MGDHMAVEIAQQSHWNLLQQEAGALRPHEVACHRRPLPRGETIEMLSIDDHITLQKVPLRAVHNVWRARDDEIFEAAAPAYEQAGLVQHPDKRRRHIYQGTFLGAELDGIQGRISAPRHRLGVLMLLTSIVCFKGCASPALLSCIVGLWIHVLMFRRPGLAIMDSIFKDAQRTPRDFVVKLCQNILCELQALVWLCPLFQTNLRTEYAPMLFCTDASPFGAGICGADLPENVLRELWRHGEQRGYYTKLEDPASAALRELGLDAVPAFGSESSAPRIPGPTCSVPRSLREGFLFDAVEVFGSDSSWSSAHSDVGLRMHSGHFGKGDRRLFEDLEDPSVFRELAGLAMRRVIREWRFGPPCLSFGSLRRPRLRSRLKPLGFRILDPGTALHNKLAQRVAFLCGILALSGCYFSVEQPGHSVMFYLHCFRVLVSLGGVVTRLCCCSFGSAFKQPLVWLHNKPWLVGLARPCRCASQHRHLTAQGVFTPKSLKALKERCVPSVEAVFGREPSVGERVSTFSSIYPLPLTKKIAVGSRQALDGSSEVIPLSLRLASLQGLSCGSNFFGSTTSQGGFDCSFESRPFYDDPEWIGELGDALQFRELIRYKFAKGGHINVLETRAYKTWLKWCAKRFRCARLLGLFDSRVLLGASAKGRSSSPSISRVLRSVLPYVLGCQLYPAGLHIASSKNRSDGPSRWTSVPAPTKEWPLWLLDLVAGDTHRFDVAVAASAVPKLAARWLRLLLLLGGDIEPHPGPPRDALLRPRGPLDLRSGFASSTQAKMRKAYSAFVLWLTEVMHLTARDVLASHETASLALRAFGLYLYESGHPRYLLVYAITAVQDAFPAYRSKLTPAWQIDKKWQLAEPGECRPVISQPILQAAVSIALLWGWQDWAAITIIGFLCMLHPSEFVFLTRGDLVFPSDALSSDRVAYVHLRHPKTARFARRQHCRLEDQVSLLFLEHLYLERPWDERLFRGSLNVYRSQWNAIMTRLEVPHTLDVKGATPGVLRGSGATFLYLETEDIALVGWRGRWAKTKTIEFYLQEVGAQLLLQRLPAAARRRIALLRDHSRALLLSFCGSARQAD